MENDIEILRGGRRWGGRREDRDCCPALAVPVPCWETLHLLVFPSKSPGLHLPADEGAGLRDLPGAVEPHGDTLNFLSIYPDDSHPSRPRESSICSEQNSQKPQI